jgi:hypothetical protein
MGGLSSLRADNEETTLFTNDSRGGFTAVTTHADGSTDSKTISKDRNGNIDAIRRSSTAATPAPTPYVPVPVAMNHKLATTHVQTPVAVRRDRDPQRPVTVTEGKFTATALSAAAPTPCQSLAATERTAGLCHPAPQSRRQ